MDYYKKMIKNRKSRFILCFAVLFIIIIVNCFLYFSKAIKPDDELVIVIDPGHGGNDPGKVGINGVDEKDINLSIALKLKESLEKRGVRVVMTRENDASLATLGATNKKTSDMNNRIEIINSCHADMLISIHQNSYTSPDVKGAQVFYHDSSDDSRIIAQTLQNALVSEVDPENKREAKAGNDYFILRKSTCPGVIIECGFLSCPKEAAKLVDEEYQWKIAETIAGVIYKIGDDI